MTVKRVRRGISRAEWLETAMQALALGNVASISVEGLAKKLGIAKSGFYWHFKSRDDLLGQMLDYWTHEITEVITENQEVMSLPPRKRLRLAAEMILDHDLTRFEMGIRQWAMTDKNAARAVRSVNRKRMAFIRQALQELGKSGDDAEMRAMLFTCYHTWEASMFPEMTRKRRRELIAKRVELLTS